MLLGLALIAGPSLVSSPGLAEAKPAVKLSKVFPFLDKYLALPGAERNHFTLTYRFLADGKPAAGLKAVIIEADGRRMPLTFTAEGRPSRLPTSAELNSASFQAETDAATKLGVQMDILPLLPLTPEYRVSELDLAINQTNAGIAKSAGMLGFAAPKMNGIVFLGAGAGRAKLSNGKELILPVVKGASVYDPKVIVGAISIQLVKAPSRLDFKD